MSDTTAAAYGNADTDHIPPGPAEFPDGDGIDLAAISDDDAYQAPANPDAEPTVDEVDVDGFGTPTTTPTARHLAWQRSQNGWSIDPSLMATFTIPGTPIRVTYRTGDTAEVLLYIAEQWNLHVEPLTQADTGGYNPRSIIGSNIPSNHASGTAGDNRWQRHARGAHGTFTPAQITVMRKILAFVNQTAKVVRWGEDYVYAPIDGMHVEVICSPAELAVAADRIRAWRAGKTSPTTASPGAVSAAKAPHAPSWPKGTPAFVARDAPKYSATVEKWQARMKARGWVITVDGRYGHKSAAIAADFQREKHLVDDGILGPITYAAAWTAKVTR